MLKDTERMMHDRGKKVRHKTLIIEGQLISEHLSFFSITCPKDTPMGTKNVAKFKKISSLPKMQPNIFCLGFGFKMKKISLTQGNFRREI